MARIKIWWFGNFSDDAKLKSCQSHKPHFNYKAVPWILPNWYTAKYSYSTKTPNINPTKISTYMVYDEFQERNNVLLLQLNDERSVARGQVITSGRLHGRDVPVELTVVLIKKVWDKSCLLQYHAALDEENYVLIIKYQQWLLHGKQFKATTKL